MLKVKIGSSNELQVYSQFHNYEEFITTIEIWLFDYQQYFMRGELYGLN